MVVTFVINHYDSKEYLVNDEQEYVNRICEMTGIPAMSVAIMDNDTEIWGSLKTSQDVSRNGFVEPFCAPIYCKKRGF